MHQELQTQKKIIKIQSLDHKIMQNNIANLSIPNLYSNFLSFIGKSDFNKELGFILEVLTFCTYLSAKFYIENINLYAFFIVKKLLIYW